MKLFFVGGTYRPGHGSEPPPTMEAMAASMQPLAAELASASHDLALCSPYEGSVDLEIMRGAAVCGVDPTIEIHYPNTAAIRAAVHARSSELGLRTLREFTHAPMEEEGEKAARYAWLLAQLGARETAHVVIAAGGYPSGSANMLLHLAAARRKLILPFGHLGGAAARSLDRHRYELDEAARRSNRTGSALRRHECSPAGRGERPRGAAR
jgi:hypothetical protein